MKIITQVKLAVSNWRFIAETYRIPRSEQEDKVLAFEA